jgi:hypothetical protein
MAIQGFGFSDPIRQYIDQDGAPYAGGSLTFTQAGTSVPQNVYSDPALTVSLGNVVTLNAAGRTSTSASGPDTPVYFPQLTYDYTLKSSAGVTIWGPITFSVNSISGTTTGGPAGGVGLRLSLTTGVPVTTTDVTAATTLCLVPYTGNSIQLYNGSSWDLITTAQISIAVPATTSQMYDIFCFSNSGTATLELLAWTNDTTRATALVYQNGILVKSGALTRRYLGSFRTTTVSGQTEDSAAKRFLYNYYNRVSKNVIRLGASNWNYTLATWRQANADTANQVEAVQGLSEDVIHMRLVAFATNSVGTAIAAVGIGLDSTTLPNVQQSLGALSMLAAGAPTSSGTSSAELMPSAGYHKYVWLEESVASGVTTWFGQGPLGAGGNFQAGIFGSIQC